MAKIPRDAGGYPFIWAYEARMGASENWIIDAIKRAKRDNAPFGAYRQKEDGSWLDINDLPSDSIKGVLILEVWSNFPDLRNKIMEEFPLQPDNPFNV